MTADNASSSGFFETLLDSIVDAVIIIDGEGKIQRFNRSAQLMFGYSPEEVLQQNVSMLMPEPVMSQHDGYLRRYRETGRAAIIGKGRDERGMRKSGETFPMRLSVGESRHAAEVHFVGIIHDLSRQHATEAKIKDLERQLFHADRLLTLGELTAGIAHEINQPLTAIAAYADAARHLVEKMPEGMDPAVHDICSRIGDQSRRAAAVVSRLRLLVRSGAAKKLRCNMIDIIKNVLLLFDYNVNKNKILIHILVEEESPDVYVDEIQIQQILVNLIKNSMDAILECDQQHGRIDIRVAKTPEELHVSVQDNGAGISADGLTHLFEPFYTSKAQGVGLGLSICKNIASAHGGTLVCDSSQPGETRFLLTLPLSSIG
jgi:two-component system sensor kinase FixL